MNRPDRSREPVIDRLLLIVGLMLSLTVIGTIGIHLLTEKTWLESCYLAIITLTTVGSVDVAQGDPTLMLFQVVYLILGLGVVMHGVFQLGATIVDVELRRILGRRRMQSEIGKLKEHFVICGLGRMGVAIGEHLTARAIPFVVIDINEEVLETMSRDRGWFGVAGDATDDTVLTNAGIGRARGLATVLPTDADNVYVVLSARMLCNDLQIIARASDDAAMKKLERAGATRVVSPFSSGAVKMARFLLNPSIEDFLEVADDRGSDLELADVQITPDNPLVGKQLAETDLRERGVMVIGIRRANGERLLPPPGTAVIQAGDSLFAFGSSDVVNAMIGEKPPQPG